MPIYLYECKSCFNRFEKIVTMNNLLNLDDLMCEVCESSEIERIIGKSNFRLKGDGWYKDGYGGNTGDDT